MLNKCCCCSLRTGSLIIGWLGIIGAVIQFIIAIFLVVYSEDIANKIVDQNQHQTTHFGDTKPINYEQREAVRAYLAAVFLYGGIAAIIGCIFALIIDGLMIFGIDKNKPGYMMPFLILTGIGLALSGLGAIFSLIAYLIAGQFAAFFGQLISTAIGFGLGIYLYMVVYSLYKNMRQSGYGQAPVRVEYGVSKR